MVPGPVAASDHVRPCVDDMNRWSGQILFGDRHGVSAYLEGQTLKMCTHESVFEKNGTFAFVNIEGHAFNDIIQVGIGRCRFPFYGECTWGMETYYAWGRTQSSEGCDIWQDRLPSAHFTPGVAYDGQTHDYKIHHADDYWNIYVDHTRVMRVGEVSLCWNWGRPSRDASWFGESLDQGDAIGGSVGNKYSISSANYANQENGGFYWTGWNPGAACNLGGGIYKCDITSSRSLLLWTDR